VTAIEGAGAAARPDGVPRWRRLLVAVLVVVGCLLAPISVLGLWARNTVLETDQYVDTVGPLVDDPAIQEALATRVQERLFEAIDVESEVADALPPSADFVVPFVADGLERFVHDATLRFVSSHEFERLWDGINRRAHAQVLAVLEGEGTETVQTRDGKIVLELDPLVDRVQSRLSDLGVDVFDDSTGERLPSEFVLFESESLRSAQSGVRLIDRIAFVLPVFTLLLFAVAIWLSPNRRRTGLRAALGVVLAMVLVLTGFNLGRSTYLDAIENAGRDRDAAAAVYDQVLSLLRLGLRTVLALGLVIAVGLWFAGPGRVATRIRGHVIGLVRGRSEGESTAVGRFVATNRTPLRVLVVGAGLVVLVVLSHPGPVAVLVVAGLVVVGLLVVEFLGRGARSITP
jgi:hypothetical protein